MHSHNSTTTDQLPAEQFNKARQEPSPAIVAHNLVKVFGETRAVDGVDLSIPKGKVYGFLGPNGAGKTTTIRMLATLLQPDEGNATVFGHDLIKEADAVRSRISLTGQFASVDDDMTGMENLTLIARLLGYQRKQAAVRAAELLQAFDLEAAANRQVKKYSGGMRRRIDIAASIVNSPELLFLDEPTTGLDPRSRNQVWDIIRALVSNGTTILLTTQYLEEADQLADRIAVIDKGKIIAEGTAGELKRSIGGGSLHVRLLEPEHRSPAEQILAKNLDSPIRLDSDPAALSAQVNDTKKVIAALGELEKAGIHIAGFSMGQPSLDEVFLKLTGEPAHHTEENEEMANG